MGVVPGINPTIEREEFFASLRYWLPFGWLKIHGNRHRDELIQKIEQYFGRKCVLFDGGRSALYAILSNLDKDGRDEVILQAFTCVVVPNAIRLAGYKPVFVDTEPDSVNMSVADLKSKITPKTRAVMVQHTFGFPDKIDEIKNICEEKNIHLIEDLAHSLSGRFKDRLLGTFGDSAFLSFGSGKVITSGCGGAVITDDDALYTRVKSFEESLKYLLWTETFKQINRIIFFTISKPFYFILHIGKAFIYFLRITGMTPITVTDDEKRGNLEKVRLFRLPNSLAHLALIQWEKLEKFLDHRRSLASIYESKLNFGKRLKFNDGSSYLHYPILVSNPKKIFSFLKKNHIQLIHEWEDGVLYPKGSNLYSAGYVDGTCPNAKKLGESVLTLPVSPTIKSSEAKDIINLLNDEKNQNFLN